MLNNKLQHYIFFILLTSSQLFAQIGPELPPCENCDQLTLRVNPYTGFWYNPEQSGSGLNIEIKNRTVFGIYNGYDDEGKPVWFTFVGQLQPSSKTGVMWELDADLLEFKDGNSLNADYQAPTVLEPERQIHINFNHMSHASFSVDGGLMQNIVPLPYGLNYKAFFPEKTSLTIPELEGFWVFAFRVNTEVHPPNQYFVSGFHQPIMIHLYKAVYEEKEDGTGRVIFLANELQPVPELGLINGSVSCETFLDENNTLQGPICIYGTVGRAYKMSIGGISHDKLFGESENGYTFKAFRYDYCEFDSRGDITYVCEYDYSDNK